MKKSQVIEKIKDEAIVAVIRANSSEEGLKVVDAVVKGGIKIIELTMTVPGAVDIIKELSNTYKGQDVLIGAGTVLDSETARMVILAGAQFVVSPCLSVDVMKTCNRYNVAAVPGIMTVKEAVEALEYGADILKIFPANAFEPSIIGAFRGPLPQAEFMPTGGVNTENAGKWIKAGAVAIGTGSNLTAGAKNNDYEAVTNCAKEFVEAVRIARK